MKRYKAEAVYLLHQAVRCKASCCSETVINEISRMLFSLIPGIQEDPLI